MAAMQASTRSSGETSDDRKQLSKGVCMASRASQGRVVRLGRPTSVMISCGQVESFCEAKRKWLCSNAGWHSSRLLWGQLAQAIAQAIYLPRWPAFDRHNPTCLLRDHHFAAAMRVLASSDGSSTALYHEPAASTSQARSEDQAVSARAMC